jgi:nucleoside-diphosphate-sugar epimerase
MDRDVVIITGSCGRIGTRIVKKLGEKYRIVGFDLLKAIYASDREELVPVDLSSDESVHAAFLHIKSFYGTRIASVIHLAAYYSFSEKDSDKYDLITVKGTEGLLNALKGFDVEQFLFSSTMLVHAPTEPGKPIDENSPLSGSWGYPRSKIETEKAIHELRGKIPSVSLRIAGVYDDQCHSIPISNQIQRIYEKKLEARMFPGNTSHGAAFVHMDDLIDAIALAVGQRKKLPPELTLLIGEPKTMSVDAMQRKISRLLFGKEFTTFRIPKLIAKLGAWAQCAVSFKHKPFIRPWMIDFADDHYELDIGKAKETLGWEPRHSVEETLPKMIDALKKDPVHWYKINGLRMPHHLEKKLRE